MRNLTTLLIAAIIALVLATYMFVFRVNFDEHVVKTTWGAASAPTASADELTGNSGSVITEPGLYFKWPWPINKVYNFTTRVQLLEQELAQFQTADNNSVALQTYVTWRIVDPYRFFVSLQNVEQARDVLGTQTSNLLGEITQYRFDQLVNLDPAKIKLGEIETNCTAQLAAEVARLDYGIQIEQVGIRRLVLPESTTQKVFERMRSTRERLAASAKQEGENEAVRITAEAERVKGQILSFANAEATKIKSEGLKDAGQRYATFAENTELAVFLRQVDTLKKMLPGSTLILDANALEFLNLIRTPTPGEAE
ncbi:MAG: protease modulator HflC [Algisphaera sp.]